MTKAAHFYTMAIDKLAKGLERDEAGFVDDASLARMEKSARTELAKLLAGRAQVYLAQGDIAAAEEDAATSTRADILLEDGHLALLAVFKQAGAPARGQLQVVERGLDSCPVSEALVQAKWRLKKELSLQPPQAEEEVDSTTNSAAVLGRNFAEPGPGQDLHRAQQLLQLAAGAGDIDACRRLGVVLLELQRPEEAAKFLAQAAESGDLDAAEILQRLGEEAQKQQAEAQAKLEALAAQGDLRAQAMLEEFSRL